MTAIYTWLKGRVPIHVSPRVGIELEFEKWDRTQYRMNYWKLTPDASLRDNGIEFVSSPLEKAEVTNALEEVSKRILSGHLQASPRCGVHVHLNAQYMTWEHLLTMTALYAYVEPAIFARYGSGREYNHFCVPLWMNDQLIQVISSDAVSLRRSSAANFKAGRYSPKLLQCNKYSAINFAPLRTFGTVEFRHMQGTTRMARVHEWCDFLLKLQEESKRWKDATEFVAEAELVKYDGVCNMLGLRPAGHEDHIADARYASIMVASHLPVDWKKMNWDMVPAGVAAKAADELPGWMRIDEVVANGARIHLQQLAEEHVVYDEVEQWPEEFDDDLIEEVE